MKGHTYFKRWGFSINEGVVPNIHVSWWSWQGRFAPFFYICWWPGKRFFWPRHP